MDDNELLFTPEEETDEKPKKKRAKKKTKTSNGGKYATFGIAALVLSIVVFTIFTAIQRNVVQEVKKKYVVVAIKDVPQGILLTKETIPDFFAKELRVEADLPANVYESGSDLIGLTTDRAIAAKEVVSPTALREIDWTFGVEDPVLFSITVSDFGQAVAGTLRTGDLVDVRANIRIMTGLLDETTEGDYSLDGVEGTYKLDETVSLTEGSAAVITKNYDEETQETTKKFGNQLDFDMDGLVWSPSKTYVSVPLMDSVRVYSVYTAGGLDTEAAEADGSKQIATVVTVVIPRYMASSFELACSDGEVYFTKLMTEETKSMKELLEEDGMAELSETEMEVEE